MSVRLLKPKARGWHADGKAGGRVGYPPLFLGEGVLTKMLVEIAALEPAALNNLPEMANLQRPQLGANLRRLVAQGLVRRFKDKKQTRRHAIALNWEHPQYTEIRSVLCSIGARNGIIVPDTATSAFNDYEPISEWVTYEMGARARKERKDTRELFGNLGDSTYTMFGSPHRTNAIFLVGAVGPLDGSMISKVLGVDVNDNMRRLLRPIEADDIFECEVSGVFNMFRLKPEPWTSDLVRLIEAILDMHPHLRSQANATAVMARSGTVRARPRKPGIIRRDTITPAG